ncbi:MAG: helix-turn-helix domain-containing protein [Chitinophagaceae bacterium]|nr:MAG: helix-turn-helix domain-containing protein [Chitinophagaceae bacterium]
MPGHIIRKYREMKNYSQKYVAAKLGVSQNAYSKIENNITQLTVHHVKELSRILETPVTDLLNDDFEIHKPVSITGTVNKTEVLAELDMLRKKLEKKHPPKHPGYLVAMSLLVAVDHTIMTVD